MITLRPGVLWAASAVAWGAEIFADAANLPNHVWALLLGAALVLTMAAIQCVAITRRLDRQYTAMMQAAIRLRISAPLQVVPPQGDVPEGVVVSFRDRAQLAAGETGE